MDNKVNKQAIGLVLFFAALTAAILVRFVKTAPFLYVGLLAFLSCLFLSFSFNRSRFWKAFFYILGIAMLVGGATEAYFTWFGASLTRKNEIQTREWSLRGGDYYVADAARGYAVGPDVKKRVKKTLEDKVIYDVVYSTNGQGLRIAPHDVKETHQERSEVFQNVIFLGDSFIFGEGLNDEETIPYLFEELSGGQCRTYNFGFHGYGAQQMLRIIETGLLDKTVSNQQPMVVVYGALLQHIERASGRMIWDAKVPRYRLSPSGVAEFVGTFADDPNLEENLKRSRSLSDPRAQLIAGLTGPARTQEDIKLFVQMVFQARDSLAKKHQARFYVLVWPLGDKDASAVVSALQKGGIEVISTDQVFKEYPEPPEKYRIELDNHPTKLATERIARFLYQHIL
jgi:hypothetical protein